MEKLPKKDDNSVDKSDISTIYVYNLNEKIGLTTMKKKLLELFTNENWEPVIGITAHKNLKLRGKAFISFTNHEECMKCYNSMKKYFKGYEEEEGEKYLLFGKYPKLKLAKKNSDVVFEKNLPTEEFEKYLNDRKHTKSIKIKELRKKIAKENKEKKGKNGKKRGNDDINDDKTNKKLKVNLQELPPNKVLLLQNLPRAISEDKLNDLFDKYSGFLEIRLVKIRNVCFVEFENENDATEAKNKLQGNLKLDDQLVTVSYARR